MRLFKRSKIHHKAIPTSAVPDYFQHAQSWAEDRFTGVESSRHRYQMAFLAAMLSNGALALAMVFMLPLQRIEPLLIHHYDNGVTTVEEIKTTQVMVNRAQIDSDIVRYVTNRENFDSHSYRAQYDLVVLLSNHTVSLQYQAVQNSHNVQSPINVLGNTQERSVQIVSINRLDTQAANQTDVKHDHHNLAEVVFNCIDTDKATGKTITHAYNALISWRYTAVSNNPAVRWRNWDGFEVTSYRIQPRNLT